MIECSVCGAKNPDLAIVCSSCKGFLQGRPEALDLFATMWGLMEAPRRTMKRIVLARRKNYVFFLAALAGILGVVCAFWLGNMAHFFPSGASMAVVAVGGGAIGGMLLALLLSLVLALTSLVFGGRPSVRNLFAVFAYSGFPYVLVLFFVFPVQFAVFGQYLFDHNPSPMILNAPVHFAIVGFYALAVIWWLLMVVVGNAVASSFGVVRSVMAVVVSGGVWTGVVTALLAVRPFGI